MLKKCLGHTRLQDLFVNHNSRKLQLNQLNPKIYSFSTKQNKKGEHALTILYKIEKGMIRNFNKPDILLGNCKR